MGKVSNLHPLIFGSMSDVYFRTLSNEYRLYASWPCSESCQKQYWLRLQWGHHCWQANVLISGSLRSLEVQQFGTNSTCTCGFRYIAYVHHALIQQTCMHQLCNMWTMYHAPGQRAQYYGKECYIWMSYFEQQSLRLQHVLQYSHLRRARNRIN